MVYVKNRVVVKCSLGYLIWFCLLFRLDVVGMVFCMWGVIYLMGFLFLCRIDNEFFEFFLMIGCVVVDGGVVGN